MPVHVQYFGPHGLGDLADLSRVGRREDLETVRGYDDLHTRLGGRVRVVNDTSRHPTGADHMRVAREAEQPRLARLHFKPAGGGQHVDDGVRLATLGPHGSGTQRDRSSQERAANDVHPRPGARYRFKPCSNGSGRMPNTDSIAFAGVALPSTSIRSEEHTSELQ